MTPKEAVEKAEKAESYLEYPDKTNRPVKGKDESNADFGRRLDAYEFHLVEWRERMKLYQESVRKIERNFKTDLLESLGIASHPKANKLYDMAWEEGHSEGYQRVADVAEELAELLG